MEEMWNMKFHEVNASQWGAGHSRPRNLATNICNIPDIPDTKRSDPNSFLSEDVYCKGQVINCIVASDGNTHTPPTVFSRKNNTERLITVAEAEQLLLWPQGVTDGGDSRFGHDRATRMKMIGNAIGGHHLREILYRWHPTKRQAVVNNIRTNPGNATQPAGQYPDPAIMTAGELEAALKSMSDDELDAWIAMRSENYSLPELDLEVEESAGPYAKPGVAYHIPAGQVEAVMHQVKQQVDKGYMQEVTYEHGMWVSPGFGKYKGREWPGTSMRMYRILTDLRKLNAVLKKPPAHWVDSVLDARELSKEVPPGSTHFLGCDISDAFSTCKLTERAQKLCVVELNGRFFMYMGGPQGLAPMALFWNAHVQDGFHKIMGNHWRKMWICFVDDMGVHGKSPEEVTTRARILSRILVRLEKPHAFGVKGDADNTWKAAPKESMVLAGLKYSARGISCNEEILEALKRTLTQYKVTNKEDAQHVIGTIQYSYTAFQWDDASLTRYSSLMKVLNDAMKVASAPRARINWDEACKNACIELHDHIVNRPLAYWSPFELINDDNCLVSMTDASDDGVAGCLFVVKKADARDVTMADLQDHTVSTLIAINSKILDEGQRTWNTYEAEILAAVRMVQKHGSYITTATAKFPTSGPNFKAKIGFLSDSTTAIGRWKALTIPIGDIEHLSAKSRRFFSWADICAGTRYWPFTINHLSGNDISLPHMLSHLGNLAKTKAKELKAVGIERTVKLLLTSLNKNQ